MLVSLFRSGPLRHHIAKGYIVAADDVDRLLTDLVARPPVLPAPNGIRFGLRVRPEQGAVWLATGPQWLLDPARRRALVAGLAEGTATLAGAVAARGGALLPSGWAPAAPGPGWLCADLHAVEVLTDVQRELCANLFRRYVPELVALTGRAAFSPGYVDRAGSRRLAEAADQVPTRYLASASATHIARVRESLRRHDGVARLELMDINPLGSPEMPVPNVEVRCLDAQLFPVDVVAQALLVQAIAMRARRMEQDGERVPPTPQRLLDRNRSRGIADGFAARFDEDDRPSAGRSSSGGKLSSGGRPPAGRTGPTPTVPVRDRVLRLAEELVDEFIAMQVDAAELAPILIGPSIADAQPRAVCVENDLLRLAPPAERVDRGLHDAGWLAQDHLTAANERLSPGSVAVARAYWSGRLDPKAQQPPARNSQPARPATAARPATTARPDTAARPTTTARPDTSARPATTARPATAANGGRGQLVADLLGTLRTEAVASDTVTEALRRYLREGGPDNLVPELRPLVGDDAKAVRRTLRPAPPLRRTVNFPPADWERGGPGEVARLARESGRSLLDVRMPVEQRREAADAIRQALRNPPPGVRLLLITDVSFRDAKGQQVTMEIVAIGVEDGDGR